MSASLTIGSAPARSLKFAIIIPCYNAAATIGETLRSVAKCNRLENISKVFVIDDCSSDGSAEVAERSWSGSIPLVVHRFETNQGQWPVTNFGLSDLTADVDWTFLLHADDVVKENWIELYLAAIPSIPSTVASICSSYDVWFSDTGVITRGEESPQRANEHIQGTTASVRDTLENGCWWHISGCAIRNSSFRQIGDFDPDLPMLGDWDWLLRALAGGHGIWYIPRTTMFYRQLHSSVSGRSFRVAQDLLDRLTILKAHADKGFINRPELRSQVVRTLRHLGRRDNRQRYQAGCIGNAGARGPLLQDVPRLSARPILIDPPDP